MAPRRTFLTLLRLVLAGVLLWLVARAVPWQDRLIHTLAHGEESYAGDLLEDWKAEVVTFRFDVPDASGADAPAGPLAELARSGASVRASRTRVVELEDSGGSGGGVEGDFAWRPGMPRAFADLELSGLAAAFAFLLLGSLFAATRWWRLLALIGCRRSWGHVLRLTYIGLFFNLVLPGLNGGDLARGVLVVRENPGRRADALMSVVVDRLVGLVAMIAVALVAVLLVGQALSELFLPVGLAAGVTAAALACLQSRRLRRWLRVDALLARLPQGERLARLDTAWMVFARRRSEMALAFLLSFGNHFAVTTGVYCLGHAVGDALGFVEYLAVVSVTNTVTSLPISPGGWGLGEASFHSFFQALGAQPTLGVAASVTYRLCNVALGLAGGLTLVLPGERLRRAELEAALREP